MRRLVSIFPHHIHLCLAAIFAFSQQMPVHWFPGVSNVPYRAARGLPWAQTL
jgi:hypothetical protein